MKFLFVKLYEEYKRTNTPDPEGRVTLYFSYVVLMGFYSIFIPLWLVIETILFDNNVGINPIVLIVITGIILIIGYKRIYKIFFRQKRIYKFQKDYCKYSINRVLLYLIIIVLPLFLLMLGFYVGIILTGGEILGEKIKGLIE